MGAIDTIILAVLITTVVLLSLILRKLGNSKKDAKKDSKTGRVLPKGVKGSWDPSYKTSIGKALQGIVIYPSSGDQTYLIPNWQQVSCVMDNLEKLYDPSDFDSQLHGDLDQTGATGLTSVIISLWKNGPCR